MIKNIFAFILIVILAQNIFSQKHKFNIDAPILSFKAGYHSGDKIDSYDAFPPGFSIDGTAEFATGKGWYICINYDLSFGSDIEYEFYLAYPRMRDYIVYSFYSDSKIPLCY